MPLDKRYTYDKIRPKDKHVEAAYQETCDELNVDMSTAREVVNHFMNWQHHSFANAEYAEYYWPKFGVFRYFNMENRGTYYPEADEVQNRRKLKDKNRDIDEEDLNVTKEHKTLIHKVTTFEPELVKQLPTHLKHFGWYRGGSEQEGGWNILTMKASDMKLVAELLHELEQLTNQN